MKWPVLTGDNSLGFALGATSVGFLIGLILPATRREAEGLGSLAAGWQSQKTNIQGTAEPETGR